jgi:hypothetical protein
MELISVTTWSRHGFRYIGPMYGLNRKFDHADLPCPGQAGALVVLIITAATERRKSATSHRVAEIAVLFRPCCPASPTPIVAVAVARPNLRWTMVPYRGGARREAPYLCVMPVSGDFTTACDIWLGSRGTEGIYFRHSREMGDRYTFGTRGRWG